jgi:hypothetical protein
MCAPATELSEDVVEGSDAKTSCHRELSFVFLAGFVARKRGWSW